MTTQVQAVNLSSNKQALILFAHGARDARWAEPIQRVQQLIMNQIIDAKNTVVCQAFLELMSPSLSELVAQLDAQQIQSITIVPLFLGQGGHVRRDLPELIQHMQHVYPHIDFQLTPAIGEDERVLLAIADVCLQQVQ